MAARLVFLAALSLLAFAYADECSDTEAAGLTDCHSCVEITILGGRKDCAYCANPRPGFVHCQKPFYPPQADFSGATYFACYNDSGFGPALTRYQARCSNNDCFLDQCTVSNTVLWYIIVPCVVGGVLLIGGGYLLWCCHKRRQRATKAWIEKEERAEKKSAEKRSAKSRARHNERKNKTDELRRKYGLLEEGDDDL